MLALYRSLIELLGVPLEQISPPWESSRLSKEWSDYRGSEREPSFTSAGPNIVELDSFGTPFGRHPSSLRFGSVGMGGFGGSSHTEPGRHGTTGAVKGSPNELDLFNELDGILRREVWTLRSVGAGPESSGGVRTFSPIPRVLRDQSSCLERLGLKVVQLIHELLLGM